MGRKAQRGRERPLSPANRLTTPHHSVSSAMVHPLNPAIAATFPPPVMEARRWLQGLTFSHERPLINVSQAAPVDSPPLALREALAEAAEQGVAGKAVTPFVLARVNALTGGLSLASNIELVRANARLAAAIAAAFATLSPA